MILSLLLPIALKSLLVAAAVLLLLKIAERRSAADRSLIAHLGLAALLALPLAAMTLPTLDVAGPEFLASAPLATDSPAVARATPELAASAPTGIVAAPSLNPATPAASPPRDWTIVLYAFPAAILFALTLLALARLVLLKHRATVMVEAGWLSALAQAQRRMGFKHGTALLTSDDLPSPISWGVVRPVILLNRDAAGSSAEAEAVIAHELAHVANFDWAKLLLARVCIALFWFNPLVWLLAREAHQLREEAADDAVLAANIEDTDYAKLLVGVARHECRGLLIGAHGVAPSKNSLARRVRRVLDGALNRAPGGWRWTSAAAFFAAGMAVPLAALTIVPDGRPTAPSVAASGMARGAASAGAMDDSAAVTMAPWSVDPVTAVDTPARTITKDGNRVAMVASEPGDAVMRRPDGTIMVANKSGRAIMYGPDGTTFVADADGTATVFRNGRAVASAGARTDDSIDDAVAIKVLEVTPDYARSMAAAGYPGLDRSRLIRARALGIDATFARSFAKVGYGRLPFDRLVEFKTLGVTSTDVRRYRAAYGKLPDPDQMVRMKALGVGPRDVDPELDPDHDPDLDPEE